MIIDAHTHLFTEWMKLKGPSPKGLMSNLNSCGIDKAIAFTLQGFFGDCRRHNDELAQLVAECPGQLYAFGTVDPYEGEAGVAEVKRCVKELGMVGIKLHPWLQGFSLTIPIMDAILEQCADLNVPLTSHDGTPPYCSTPQVANLADSHPEVAIILAHSGLRDQWLNALQAARRLPNLYLCTCGTPLMGLQKFVDVLGAERILFGSDAGFGDPGWLPYNLEKIYLLDVSEKERQEILGGNAARLLKLEKRTT